MTRVAFRLSLIALMALPVLAAQPAWAKGKKKKKKPAPAAEPAPAPAPSAEAEPEIEIAPDDAATPPADTPTEPTIEPDTAADTTATDPAAASGELDLTKEDEKSVPKLTDTRSSWEDIVVVIRKPFLKDGRFELTPAVGVTLNDNMIRHYQLNGQLTWWLTDVLGVGLEGQFMSHTFLETYDQVAFQQRRIPTLNQYNYGAALNFHYVPIYAKFSMFNNHLIQMEGMLTVGVGFTQTEVLPRDPTDPGWTNNLITPNVGFTLRVFMADWITLNLGFKDYIFIDQFEDANRSSDPDCAASVACSKDRADGKLINHVMFSLGVSFWFPTSFEYTTFR
jgi:outer membrane beta-barrel protein